MAELPFRPSKVAHMAVAKDLVENQGVDPFVAPVIADLIMGSSDDSSVDSFVSEDSDKACAAKLASLLEEEEPKPFKTRKRYHKRKQEDSTWYQRYLRPEVRADLLDASHRDAMCEITSEKL